MSELLGWTSLLPIECDVITSLAASDDVDLSTSKRYHLEKQVRKWIQQAREVNPAIVDHMRAGCEKAREQFHELASTCANIVAKQQVLYNQPVKLSCFPGIEVAADYHKDISSLAKRMRQECMKVLKKQR